MTLDLIEQTKGNSKNDPQLISDYDFWMLLRQGFFLMISAIDRKLGIKPTTKERLDFWKQCNRDITHADYPDYETDEI